MCNLILYLSVVNLHYNYESYVGSAPRAELNWDR